MAKDNPQRARERSAKWARENPERHARNRRNWLEKNKDKIAGQRAAWFEANPDAQRWWGLKHKYGLTREQYMDMLADQEGRCAACGDPPAEGKHLHVDHCHATGQIRALLCGSCNKALGLLKDDVHRAKRLTAYIGRFGKQVYG